MIWKSCTLLREITETDALGNVVGSGQFETVATALARFTPWTVEETALIGLDVTENEQRYAVPVSYSVAKSATHVMMDGVTLKVKETRDLAPRWTLLSVEVFRV